MANVRLHIIIIMALSIVGHNVNGFMSSVPYVDQLLSDYDIVGISEHWKSGPELGQLDISKLTHNIIQICHNNIVDGPPERGRGYGGLALYYRKGLNLHEYKIVDSDRFICAKVDSGNLKFLLIFVYLPST